MTSITTERLTLRPIAAEDAASLHTFWTDPDVRHYLWDGKIIPVETVREVIDESRRSFEQDGFGFFALTLKENGDDLIGFCGYRPFEDGEDVELLYGILPAYWGEGLVTEAGLAVLQYGFETCGFDQVVAATDTPNQRSVRVMQRLGMVFQCRREWRGLDTVFFRLNRDEFASADSDE